MIGKADDAVHGESFGLDIAAEIIIGHAGDTADKERKKKTADETA